LDDGKPDNALTRLLFFGWASDPYVDRVFQTLIEDALPELFDRRRIG
jgi:hypothetical protein